MRIGIDIDGTICNSLDVEYYYTIEYIIEHNLDFNVYSPRHSNRIEDVFGLDQETALTILNKISKEMGDHPEIVSPLPFAAKYVNKLRRDGHEIVFITKRSTDFWENPKKASTKLLKAYGFKYDTLIVAAKDKGRVCKDYKIDVMIDDQIDNCQEVNIMGLPTILYATSYNEGYLDMLNHRANGWAHIYEIIKQMSIC